MKTISFEKRNCTSLRSLLLLLLIVSAPISIWAQAPAISSVTPNRSIPGTSVVISGSNFNSTISSNIVRFGAIKATVLSASATSLTVNVDSGAGFAAISVLNTATHLTGYEDSLFIPTYINDSFINGNINFKTGITISAGVRPFIAVIGDIDGDGKPDLVVNNKHDNNIYIYRNISVHGSISTTSFATPVMYSTTSQPNNVRVADIDGDGKLDIITADEAVNNVSVFHNSSSPGSVSLSSAVSFSILPAISSSVIAIADFDGDGWPDIAVTACLTNNVAILHNNGVYGTVTNTSFSSPVMFPTGVYPLGVYAADIDGDGKIDLVTADSVSHTIAVLKNTSSPGVLNAGSFAATFELATGVMPIDVAIADIDGDSKPEIIVTNNLSNSISVFHNISTSGLLASSSFTRADFPAGSHPTGIAIGDIDGDGRPDIVTTNVSDTSMAQNSVSIFRNTAVAGSINSSSLAPRISYETGFFPYGVSIGDLDGDGYSDIVTGNFISNDISILRNYPLPYVAAVIGDTSLCSTGASSVTSFTDSVVGGYWSVSNTSIGSITPDGTFTAIAPGIDTITYMVVAGGDTNTKSIAIHIDTMVTMAPIGGLTAICPGSSTLLSDATPDGIWTAVGSPAIATLNDTGLVTGITSGTITVSYSVTNGCGLFAAGVVATVSSAYPYPGVITGPTHICNGASDTLTETVPGGKWFSLNASFITIDSISGLATAHTIDTVTIVYNVTSTCGFGTANELLTVNPAPVADIISAPDSVCHAGNITLTAISANATSTSWSSASGTLTVADSTTGVIYAAASSGSGTVIFTATNACGSDTSQHVIGIIPSPEAGTITGPTAVCFIGAVLISDAGSFGSGTWSISNGNATINAATGAVSGASVGADTVAYIANTMSCGADTAFYPIVIEDTLVVAPITGSNTVCVAASITLADTTSGGVWHATDAHASIASGSGILTGISAGIDTITYAVTNSCGTVSVNYVDTIKALPYAGSIHGTHEICAGSATTLTDSEGVFTSSSWLISSSTIYELSGTDTTLNVQADIYYGSSLIVFNAYNSCGTANTTFIITVDTVLAVAPITAAHDTLCIGVTDSIFSYSAGGTSYAWLTYPATTASVGVSDSTYAVLTGLDTGVFYVTHSVANVCGSTSDSLILYVNAPTASAGAITGPDSACAGTTVHLHNITAGAAGVWTSDNHLVATVDSTGIVTAVAAGTAHIYYTVNGPCGPNIVVDTFHVVAPPVLTSATSVTVCDNAGFTYVATSSVPSAFSWTRPSVTGIGNTAGSGIGDSVNEALDDTFTTAVNVPYHFLLSVAGCTTSATVNVTVEPTPVMTSAHTDTICSGSTFSYTPSSSTAGVDFTWTRSFVSGISPAINSGAGSISETLYNTTTGVLTVTYNEILTITGTTCSSTDNVSVSIAGGTSAASITTFPPPVLCSKTSYMNFGAATPPPPGVSYTWSTNGGAIVWATGTTQQYALVNFPTPGMTAVYLNTIFPGFDCPTRDSFVVDVNSAESDNLEVIYFNNDFVCLRSDVDTYQWGVDNSLTLDSTMLTGQTNQHCHIAVPEFSLYYYWVITTHEGCMQKSYFNLPAGVQDIHTDQGIELNVYPNPASDLITVAIGNTIQGGDYSADVYTMTGQKISTCKLADQKCTIDVSGLSPGMFFINCYHNGMKVATRKFIKN